VLPGKEVTGESRKKGFASQERSKANLFPMPSPSTEVPDSAQAGDAKGLSREQDRLVVEIVERDRLRLAAALHNSACQSLSGLQLLVATLFKRLPEKSGILGENMEELATLLRQVSGELRGIVQWLRPPPMREEGLIVSLLELAAEISRAIPCEFHCDDRRIEVDPYAAEQLYQIAHALVLTVVQRGLATSIEISLAVDRQRDLRLSVRDNAVFSDRSGPGHEPDLCNWELLRLRARTIGGKLNVYPTEACGTGVTCHVDANAAI
jgi:signal transduction histidine kinase